MWYRVVWFEKFFRIVCKKIKEILKELVKVVDGGGDWWIMKIGNDKEVVCVGFLV